MVTRLALVFCLSAMLSGCASAPSGKKDLLDFIQDGKTTREDVILHLAEPSTTLENGHILTYRLDEDDGGFVPNGTKGPKWTGKYSLVLSFDDQGVLRRHALVRVKDGFGSP